MEEIKKESAFEKFKDVTVQGDQRTGKLLRASQSLLKDEKHEKKNIYLQYAPQFIYPLIQEEVEGPHLDFTVSEYFEVILYKKMFSEKRRCNIFG